MWCEVELERNQMSWWLEEMAMGQLPAGEREGERERERGGGGWVEGRGSRHTHKQWAIKHSLTHTVRHRKTYMHTFPLSLSHTPSHTQTN